MFKTWQNEFRNSRRRFCFVLLLWTFRIKIQRTLFFAFSVFESRDREIDHQTNLPIDSEVILVNSSWKPVDIHIIRKLLMYWTQKYKFYSNRMFQIKVLSFFPFCLWKRPFFEMTFQIGHVIYHIKGNNVFISNTIVSINKIGLETNQGRKSNL